LSQGTASKSPQAFRTIAEASEELDVPAHVLRFWEGKFPQLRPMKRAGGRRLYRAEDMALLRGIRALLQDDGYQIKGVQKLMRDQGVAFVRQRGGGRLDRDLEDDDHRQDQTDGPTIHSHAEPAGPLFEEQLRQPPEAPDNSAGLVELAGNAVGGSRSSAGPALGIALRKALAKLEYARSILDRASH
jgi:DNA-binding transcriptional MerR regulator